VLAAVDGSLLLLPTLVCSVCAQGGGDPGVSLRSLPT
jgi:hypothetical protein